MGTIGNMLRRIAESRSARTDAQPATTTGSAPLASADEPAEPEGEAATVSLGEPFASIPLSNLAGRGPGDGTLAVRKGTDGHQLVLQLAPPGIGPVTVVLTVVEHSLAARIVADDTHAVLSIEEWLPQLRSSLAELFHVTDVRVMRRPGKRYPSATRDTARFDRKV